MLTPFKLLPFFPVRVRLGVVFVNRDLVEVLARVRVVREYVGWGHLPINESERRSGWGMVFSVWEICRRGSMAPFPLRKTMPLTIGKTRGSSEDHCRGQSSPVLRLPLLSLLFPLSTLTLRC